MLRARLAQSFLGADTGRYECPLKARRKTGRPSNSRFGGLAGWDGDCEPFGRQSTISGLPKSKSQDHFLIAEWSAQSISSKSLTSTRVAAFVPWEIHILCPVGAKHAVLRLGFEERPTWPFCAALPLSADKHSEGNG